MNESPSQPASTQRLYQRLIQWHPKPRFWLQICGLGFAVGLTAIACAIYNPDLLRPLIQAGIPLKLASGFPVIGDPIQQASVAQMTVQELKQLMDSKATNFVLIDVREPEEYETARIPGSILVPLGDIESGEGVTQIKSLIKGRRVIVHCKVGRRSAKAVVMLKAAGIEATNLKGGIQAWSREIDPSVPQY
jgi:rhodanese-related sulfurtransferase